jgi:hypothetical protein
MKGIRQRENLLNGGSLGSIYRGRDVDELDDSFFKRFALRNEAGVSPSKTTFSDAQLEQAATDGGLTVRP